jgi:hypothetical protein
VLFLKEILSPLFNLCQSFINSTVWIISSIIGVFLSAIGYPREIVLFILILALIDIITKLYALTVINVGYFSCKNFFKTWLRDRKISSLEMKSGIFAKVCIYGTLLYAANSLIICQNDLWYAVAISNTIYTALVLLELSSILENFSDCGYKNFDILLKFFRKKQEEVLKE